jgi:hypothetical protein
MTPKNASKAIIEAAISAATYEDAIQIESLIKADIGAEFQRPVGDKYNNIGLMASSGSYEYKALEPCTNQQDSILERLAAAKFGPGLSEVPYASPEKTAADLLGHLDYQTQGDMAAVIFRESDSPTRQSKRLTIVYRDQGCGMTPQQIPQTIFALGSSHKTEKGWLQGAYGLGGASTYRNAKAVVLVSRRAPEMKPAEDRISVAVVRWEQKGKGQSAYYLTTTDWQEGENSAAEPWSADASSFPGFEPGTHLALVSYGVEGFHRARSGDERAFDIILNTRLYRPITPVRFTNEITRGKNEYLRGLARRLRENPSADRQEDEEDMLFSYGGQSYRLPVRYAVFPGGATGTRRRFVAKDHALVYTSNGQVHNKWSPLALRHRTGLTKIHERVFVEVETDALPIELRTTLFTPDRSQLLANDPALQLEDQVADFLRNWDGLIRVNSDLVRDAISGASSGGSGLAVSQKIAAALRIKGFTTAAGNGGGGGTGGGGRRPRKKVDTYPDPTTFEGPDKLVVEDGKVRRLTYMLNAEDEFLESGRGRIEFECDHPQIDIERDIVVGRLRDGYVRVQLQVPEGASEGDFELTAHVRYWERSSGGLGAPFVYSTKLIVVDETLPPKTGGGAGKGGKGAGGGPHVAVLWQTPDEYGGDWHNGVPGSIDMIAAKTLAEKVEEYEPLKSIGDEEIPTIVLNKDYGPFKAYISARAKELGERGVSDARDRYAVGVGFGLLLLDQEASKKSAKSGKSLDPKEEQGSKAAVARSVLLMMPAFDSLIKEAGLAQ